MKSRNDKNVLVMLIGIFIFIMVAGGVSYAYFVYKKDVALADLTSGSINISFNTTANTSSIVSTQPISDNLGKNHPTYLEFTVNGTVDIEDILYELEIVPSSDNTLDGRYVKLYLTEVVNNEEYPLTAPIRYSELYDSIANNGKGMYQELITGNINGTNENVTHKYRLRTWVSSDYHDATGGDFSYSIYLYAENVNAENYRKLTFKFDDERVEALSKYVKLGKDYGSLPTLNKPGYRFIGWNGKNLFNKQGTTSGIPGVNVTYDNNTEIFTLNGTNTSVGNIIFSTVPLEVIPGEQITLSVREVSGNATLGEGSGSTYAYSIFSQDNTRYIRDERAVTNLTFPKLYRFNALMFTDSGGPNNKIMMQLWRTNTVFNNYQIKIQIEKGNIATEWEPYFVTSDVEVTEWYRDIVLTAKWEKLPEIELSKETYIEEDLTTWTANGVTFNNGVATLNNTSSTLTSGYIPVSGEFWYITFDAYTENVVSGKDYGSFMTTTYFYDSNYNSTTSIAGKNSDGAANILTLNEWNIGVMYNPTLEAVKNRKLYGPNVQYVKIRFHYNSSYSSIPYSLRNAKIHGQMPNSFYLINIDVDEDNDVSLLKYAKGEQTVLYMKRNGINFSDNQIRVEENGVYTVYAKYADGYENVYTIEITNIAE